MFESKRHARAYLMGVYLSDGSVETQQGNFRLGVTDKAFRDATARAMEMLGARFTLSERKRGPVTSQVTGKVYQCKREYRLRELSPYPVGRWLEREFWGAKDHLPLPYITDDIVRDLVAGVMDGDGCISHCASGQFLLAVCGCSKYLEDLRELLAVHNVKMSYLSEASQHNINIKSFVEAGFYFRMPRKQALVEAYRELAA